MAGASYLSYAPSAGQLSAWYGPSTDMVWDANHEPTAADHGDVLYTIGKSEQVGRYMVAKRDIHPGEVIFTDEPAVIGPDNNAKAMCLVCWRKVVDNFRCRDCGWPLCSDKCRKTASHQQECKLFQERGAKVHISHTTAPNKVFDVILPLRVLMLKLLNPKVYRLVTLLMDHKEGVTDRGRKRQGEIVDFIRNTCNFSRDFTIAECHHVLGILSVNSFVVHDGEEDNMDLIGLYPWTSLMSHACIPNTKIITRDDFSYVCEATILIPAGSEIVTSYHHYYYHLYGTTYRRQDLNNTWSFGCICSRCQDPTELGTMVSAMICERCKYNYILPSDTMDFQADWACQVCRHREPNELVQEKLKKWEDEIDDIDKDKPENYEKVLRRMRYSLHENHYWIMEVKRRLIDIYGNKPGFEAAKLPKETLERKSDYCDHLLSLAARLSPGQSEFRGYLLWERHGCHLRLAQYDWLRMKCTTNQYTNSLKACCENLKEIISILGPIRSDSDEGAMGLKAKHELEQLEEQIKQLHRQSLYSGGPAAKTFTLGYSRFDTKFNRRSVCI